ncbi:hypothetical protein NN6n1_01450 [Shinella zoogloeoides]
MSLATVLCEEIDGKVKAFLERPIEGDWPYLWIDATYLKMRHGGRIVSVERARYMTLESIDQLGDDPLISLPAVAR